MFCKWTILILKTKKQILEKEKKSLLNAFFWKLRTANLLKTKSTTKPIRKKTNAQTWINNWFKDLLSKAHCHTDCKHAAHGTAFQKKHPETHGFTAHTKKHQRAAAHCMYQTDCIHVNKQIQP